MPDVPTPSWVFADSTPGQSGGTNEAMPRFGGRADAGQTIHLSVDGNETTIVPTPDGSWTHTVPELANGEHDYEMWTEDANGDTSDTIEWTDDVDASPESRAAQQARNSEWQQGGAGQFLEANDRIARGEQPLTPPRPITGGGGGAPQPMADNHAPGATDVPAGIGGVRGGSDSGGSGGGGGGQPAGLEKGNAGTVGRIG